MLNVFLIHALCRAIALWASPVPTLSGATCVTESRPLMQRCGPGANVRPHDWMAPCAVFISQKGLLLSALTSHSAPLWPYGHAHLRYLHKEELCNLRLQITVTIACYCYYRKKCCDEKHCLCCYIGSWTFSCHRLLCVHGMGCVMQAVLFACRSKDTCLCS